MNKVLVDGMEDVPEDVPILVLPNHPAMVVPMLVGATFWKTPLKPFSDESFFKARIVAPCVLKTLGAVPVPDLRKNRSRSGASIRLWFLSVRKYVI